MKTLCKITVYTLKGHPYPKKREREREKGHKRNPQDKHEQKYELEQSLN